jgi:hypothetical protein
MFVFIFRFLLYRAREGRGVRSPVQSLLSFSARQQADGKRSDRQALGDGTAFNLTNRKPLSERRRPWCQYRRVAGQIADDPRLA